MVLVTCTTAPSYSPAEKPALWERFVQYTHAQLRELSVLARSLHIAVVPKLQSIAHVDYILKHDAYRGMRENGH